MSSWSKRVVSIAVCAWAIAPIAALAADGVEFRAHLDRNQISQDESVSLQFDVKTDSDLTVEEPSFSAPDFDVVNEFRSTFYEQFYENGRLGTRASQQITKVLRPQKSGNFTISGIQVKVNGQVYSAPSLTVRVDAAGSGTPPPSGFGGTGVGLRGAAKKQPKGTGFFVRAEVDKARVFKGQQVIVSYYLYRRVRTFNLQVDKYPVLPGFLREDLEMPVLTPRQDCERVTLDGTPYERCLLVRYAAYPLKEGKLMIDSMDIRSNYYAGGNRGMGDEEDDPFANFFQQLAPRVGTSKSDPVPVEVIPVPTTGKPQSFTGGVGEFDLTAGIDRTEVRANEAVTLMLKVEGRGNVSSIEAPKVQWPEGVELYESKSNIKSGKGGVGEKIFEFLLIPRKSGRVTIPAMEMSFFDPSKKTYSTKSTQPIELNVLEGAPGSQPPPPKAKESAEDVQTGSKPASPGVDLRYLKPPAGSSASWVSSAGTWATWLLLASLAIIAFVLGFKRFRSRGKRGAVRAEAVTTRPDSKSWQKLRAFARSASGESGEKLSPAQVLQAYEGLAGVIFDAIDRHFGGIGARSYSRSDLKRMLVDDRGMPAALWERASKLLEFAELVRFAGSAGGISEATARGQLEKWVTEGQGLEDALARRGARE